MLPAGGGRVTELVARPVLNLHWPRAGRLRAAAGRRVRGPRDRCWSSCRSRPGTAWRSACWSTRSRLVGLDGLAQVDLSRRKHRNQEIGKLGRMSSEILQVALERLRREGRLTLDAPVTELVQFERSEDDYLVHAVDMAPTERPPVLTVPEYRARAGR